MRNYLLALGLCTVLQIQAGGFTVGNGGGFAEANLFYAFQSYNQALQVAAPLLIAQDFSVGATIRDLEKVAAEELRHGSSLKIQKDAPTNEGWRGRDFLTTSNLFDSIYVRLDALYPQNAAGVLRPLNYTEGLALMTRILGSRLPTHNEVEWITLGKKLAKISEAKSEILYFGFLGSPEYSIPSFTLLQNPHGAETRALLVTDAEKVHDLFPSVFAFLRQQQPQLSALHLSHLSWITGGDTIKVEALVSTQEAGQTWSRVPRFLRVSVPMKPSTLEKDLKVFDPARVVIELR